MLNKMKRWREQVIFFILPMLLIFSTVFVGIDLLTTGKIPYTNNSGLAAASRMINSLFAALLTSMALIVTLTANLYTPKLATLFVKHPLTISGMAVILTSNLLIVLGNFMPPAHPWFETVNLLGVLITCIAVGGTIPYLYYVSKFIRPKFFLPLLQKNIVNGLDQLRYGEHSLKLKKDIFETYDILTNMAYTASKRDDGQLIIYVLDSSFEIFNNLIAQFPKEKTSWRFVDGVYLSGVSQEGKLYLEKEKNWPEAYMLGKTVRILSHLKDKMSEIYPYVSEKLLETMDECIDQDRDDLIELHIITLNLFFRKSIEDKNIENIRAISYSYRIAIELLISKPKYLALSTQCLLFYAALTRKYGIKQGLEIILFDLGRIITFFAYENELASIDFLKSHVFKSLNSQRIEQFPEKQIYLTAMAKAYWESLARGHYQLSALLQANFLSNEAEHIKSTRALLLHHRILHWEFNDRLLGHSYLSESAYQLASEYLLQMGKGHL